MSAPDYHVAGDCRGRCVLVPDEMRAFALDPRDASKLASGSVTRLSDERLRRAVSASRPAGAERRPRPLPRIPDAAAVTGIALFVTDRCDLRCEYCYERQPASGGERPPRRRRGDLPPATAKRVVDWLFAQTSDEPIHIGFFGGEPLLAFPVLAETVAHAERHAARSGREVNFGITTNGTHLDGPIVEFLAAHRFRVRVSMDGPQAVHDRQRPRADGSGSYAMILPGVRRLLAAVPDTVCRPTIMPGTDPSAVMSALEAVGFARIVPAPVSQAAGAGACDAGAGSDLTVTSMLRHLEAEAAELEDAIRRRDTHELRRYEGSSRLLLSIGQFLARQRSYFHCGAGAGLVAVSTDGDVYTCHRFVGDSGQRLGRVPGTLDRSTVRRSLLEERVECATCLARYTCAGGCRHDYLVSHRDSPRRAAACAVERRRTELAALAAGRLEDGALAYLREHDLLHLTPCRLDLY